MVKKQKLILEKAFLMEQLMPNQFNRRKEDDLLGRVDERLKALDRSFSSHEVEDHARFELVFNHMKDSFDKMDRRFDSVDAKLGTLWDLKNSQSGAFGASKLLVNGIWGIIVIAISWFVNNKVDI